MLAMALLRLSRPTDAEHAYLRSLWDTVTAAAGVDGSRYTLRIQESAQINAYAAGGHTVAVTRWSLQALPPHQLAAVLAHELGHHLGGHAWSLLLFSWYSLPARAVLRCARIVTRFTLTLLAFTSALGFLMVASFLAVGALVVVGGVPWLLLLALIPPVLAAFARHGELRCDRLAAELGYGPALIEVLQHSAVDDPTSRRGLLATHPTGSRRIRALEHHLETSP
jgi:Zn-dependent protease with chaperone function